MRCLLFFLFFAAVLAEPGSLSSSSSSAYFDDLRCSVEEVHNANSQQLYSILEELVNTTYFRLFKVDLERPCHRDEKVVPSCGSDEVEGVLEAEEASEAKCSLKPEASSFDPFGMPSDESVDRRLSQKEEQSVQKGASCDPNLPEFWLDMCSNIPTNASEYVNLLLNPETFTGYNGSVVWDRVHNESCLGNVASPESLCYEQHVLYRLLSGMHTSINVHISHAYYPPRKSKGIHQWASNPQRFMEQYGNNPEYIKNLHFAFVVVLRSLSKAAPALRRAPISGIANEEETVMTRALINRLLDSQIMRSCRPLFTAFDESLMFQEEPGGASTKHQLKEQFKKVFKSVSAELDCITCQKCKLHGKLFLLGLGTALKILLIPESLLLSSPLSHEEMVALINTVAKLSSAINYLEELQQESEGNGHSSTPKQPTQQQEQPVQQQKQQQTTKPSPPAAVEFDVMNTAVRQVAGSGLQGEQHDTVLQHVLRGDVALLALAQHYSAGDFARHAAAYVAGAQPLASKPSQTYDADVVVVGGGLAGLTAALTLLDAGHRVVLVEKEAYIGGNSAKASSGINGVSQEVVQDGDTVQEYASDVLTSSGLPQLSELAKALVEGSGDAVQFLRQRVGMDLSKVVQMGGHSHPRTYRPVQGMAGAEITLSLNAQAEKFHNTFTTLRKTRVLNIVTDPATGEVAGVAVAAAKPARNYTVTAPNVILATGGFALGGSEGSFLQRYRPDLNGFATTNGRWCTGDGHEMAAALGAEMVDMQDVQVHPTGFIDPKHPDAGTKTLCAELLRGVGGLLLLRNGSRFVNELGTREHITGQMRSIDPDLSFTILLHSAAAEVADKHVPMYEQKGLLTRFDSLAELAKHLSLSQDTLRDTLEQYNKDAERKSDAFGKVHFNNVPVDVGGYFYAGKVTPVLHYTMGGVKMDPKGRVLREDGTVIAGLYAAGEISGGVHGRNRLGGNALTECVVFGRAAALSVAERTKERQASAPSASSSAATTTTTTTSSSSRQVTRAELAKHNTLEDCWTAIHGKVYDLTDFVGEHPAGPEAIVNVAGTDGTESFSTAHSEATLSVFTPIGDLVD